MKFLCVIGVVAALLFVPPAYGSLDPPVIHSPGVGEVPAGPDNGVIQGPGGGDVIPSAPPVPYPIPSPPEPRLPSPNEVTFGLWRAI